MYTHLSDNVLNLVELIKSSINNVLNITDDIPCDLYNSTRCLSWYDIYKKKVLIQPNFMLMICQT